MTVCLSNEVTQTLREHTTAKGLWDALVEKIEGNAEMRARRRAMLKDEFNMFNHIQGESVGDLIKRFEKLLTRMRNAEVIINMSELFAIFLEHKYGNNQKNYKSQCHSNSRLDLYYQVI